MEKQILIQVNLTQFLEESRRDFFEITPEANLEPAELIQHTDKNGRILGKMEFISAAEPVETAEILSPDLLVQWTNLRYGQADGTKLNYLQWLSAQGWNLFRSQIKITTQPREVEYTLEDVLDAVQYGMAYSQESQHSGFVPIGNILQWLMERKCLGELPEEFKKYKNG